MKHAVATLLSGLVVLCCALSAHAQPIIINEVMASNTNIFDDFGESSDWFELHNINGQVISLEGWTVSDRLDNPTKWHFPNISLDTNDHFLIWASGKDISTTSIPRTLITEGDEFRYLVPTQPVNANWLTLTFDDTGWDLGVSGFGYGDADDATSLPQGTRSVFLRKKFNIADVDALQELILDVDYDDAFVAYINGTEVARANINGFPPAYNATAITDSEASIFTGGLPERFVLANPSNLLQIGENVLCIQVHNISSSSSDLTIIPFLSAQNSGDTNEGILPPAILQLQPQYPHANFKISAEDESIYLFDNFGNLIDSLYAGGIPSNISLGIPLGGTGLKYYDQPTPGLPNDAAGFDGFVNQFIDFSHQGGNIGAGTIQLELSGVQSPYEIRFTLDATEPKSNSALYDSSIAIADNTVVRARVFRNGYLPSKTQNRTYLKNVFHDLPVVTLVTEPENFFDNDSGIYVLGDDYEPNFPHFGANFWEDWERPIHFSFYEQDGILGTEFDGGVKIFGGWSRGNDQRSLSIFARKQYGFEEINYPLFPGLPYENFQAFVLRNSGNDWLNTMMRDVALTSLMNGAGLEYQANRPAVTYLNGEYWGFYNIREKINEHFLASKFNADSDEIDLLESNGNVVHGENEDYLQLVNFISSNNLSFESNYQFVDNQIDIENFIIYQVAQIYFDNTDWPGNNIKFWRTKNGKWRWILFDTDFGFGIWNNTNYSNNTLAFALQPNGPSWPNPPWSTLIFRKLVQNISFRNDFVNRFADELNSRFLPHRVQMHIDSIANIIVAERNAHYNRWGGNVGSWSNQVNNMKNFATLRPSRVKGHILSVFNLPDYHKLTISNEDPSRGFVRINDRLTIEESNWSGDYFEKVPYKLVAISRPGFAFSHWSGGLFSTNAEIEVDMNLPMVLVPHFVSLEGDEIEIVINEINYESSENMDAGDWIELYNPNEELMNLSGWKFKNKSNEEYSIQEGVVLPGKGYLILAQELSRFNNQYTDISGVVGDFNFDLSNVSDELKIFDKTENLKDSVAYLSVVPWPDHANGTGATIELIEPNLDNLMPENWASISRSGTPGKPNVDVIPSFNGNNIEDLIFYPNPFVDLVNIEFCVKRETKVRIKLYDLKGSHVYTFYDDLLGIGEYHFEENLSYLSSGIYILEFIEDEGSTVIKWIKAGGD